MMRGVLRRGSGRSERLTGGEDDDRLFSLAGDDRLILGAGDDRAWGDAGDDVLLAGDGNDSMFGGVGDDSALGGRGNDTLEGGRGDDVLLGGDGNDVLTGGPGADVLSGGRDADVFVVQRSAGRPGSVDEILDFGASDRLVIREAFLGRPEGGYPVTVVNTYSPYGDGVYLTLDGFGDQAFLVGSAAGDVTVTRNGFDAVVLSTLPPLF